MNEEGNDCRSFDNAAAADAAASVVVALIFTHQWQIVLFFDHCDHFLFRITNTISGERSSPLNLIIIL